MARNPLLAGLQPTHPGELLRVDVLPATGLTKTKLARMLGVSRQVLHSLLAGQQAVTPAMALRLGRVFGNDPEMWLKMQGRYDLAITGAAMQEELAQMPTLAAELAAA